MMKPFQKDIDFLKEELVHHEYIAKKFSQECDTSRASEFKILCAEIRTAIETMEKRQAAAISEWSALSPSESQTILGPLFDALENMSSSIRAGKPLPSFSCRYYIRCPSSSLLYL